MVYLMSYSHSRTPFNAEAQVGSSNTLTANLIKSFIEDSASAVLWKIADDEKMLALNISSPLK